VQDAYPGVLGGREGHTTKICCPLRFTLLISWKSEKSYAYIIHFLCSSFIDAVPSTIIIRRCVLRSTLAKPSVPTTYSMALATVNIDKIISDVIVILCID